MRWRGIECIIVGGRGKKHIQATCCECSIPAYLRAKESHTLFSSLCEILSVCLITTRQTTSLSLALCGLRPNIPVRLTVLFMGERVSITM